MARRLLRLIGMLTSATRRSRRARCVPAASITAYVFVCMYINLIIGKLVYSLYNELRCELYNNLKYKLVYFLHNKLKVFRILAV
jgi:hypothetical protein